MARRSFAYVNKAAKYARDVVNGRKVAGQYEVLACERYLRDLKNPLFTFRKDKANRACAFIENLHHVKGKWAAKGEKLKLEPWQCFVVCAIFGFYQDGVRRFVEAYVRVARKNGKSILAAAIGLYMFVEDDEYGAEIYSGATTEKQAWEVFRPARLMALQHPDFRPEYGVEVHAKNMHVLADDARFEPIIGNPGDGASPHLAIVDEYHEHKSSDMYDTMTTGMGAREQPLCLIITTAGNNIASPCYEKDDDCKKILEGKVTDESTFTIIFEPDKDDKWDSVTAMKKANPNLGVSVMKGYLERRLAKARRSPSQESTYKTKHLNKWVGAGAAFLNFEEWVACHDPAISLDETIADPEWRCVFGVDLASRIDFVALVRLFFKRVDENLHYRVFPMFWIPENRVDEDESGRYAAWAEDDLVKLHDDDEIDFAELRADIKAEAERCGPEEIAFDPWRAIGLEQELSNEGYVMVRIAQSTQNFADPMNELEAVHLSKRLAHDGNEILNWMAGNLTSRKDIKDNDFPRKEQPENKIDGMVALLNALNRALANRGGGYISGRVRAL